MRVHRAVGKRTCLYALLVIAAGIVGARDLAAQTTVDVSWRAVDPSAGVIVRDGVIALELEDAIAIALQRNLGLRIERFSRARSLFQIEGERGIYDLGISGSLALSDETSAPTSILDGTQAARQSESQSFSFQLDQLTYFGGVASLDWSNRRAKSNSSFASFNPSFGVDLDLLYSQPLLRGFGRLATERNLRISRINSAINLEELELQVANTIQQVDSTYWTLVESLRQLEVSRESLALAEELHDMNRVQVDVGTKAPLELIQSEVGISTRQEDIIRTEAAVADAADELRRLLNLEGDEIWNAAILPATDPTLPRITIDLEAALQVALDERPEIASQRLQVQTFELDDRFFRQQKLPSLDLELRYGLNGVGGDFVDRPPFDPTNPDPDDDPLVTVPGGYGDALEQALDAEFKGWQVLLNVSYPLQNRAARAQSTIARLTLEQGRTTLDDVVLSVRSEVRQTARAVQTAAQQIDSASKSRELAERQLDAEEKRYENGLSTSFQVLEIQEDLSLARSREVSAITGYRRALTRYYLAIGRLLEESGVELEDVEDLVEIAPPAE